MLVSLCPVWVAMCTGQQHELETVFADKACQECPLDRASPILTGCWKCTTCKPAVYICGKCHRVGQHSVFHEFERVEAPASMGLAASTIKRGAIPLRVLQSLVLEPAHALLVWARPVFAEDLHRKNLLRCPTASVAELHVRDHTSHWTPVLRRGSGCAVVGTDHGVPALLMGRGERYQSLDLLVRLGEVNVGNPLRFLHSQPRVEVSDWYRVYGGTEHGEFTLAIELYDDDGFMLLRKQTTFDATQQWAKASVAVPSHEFPQVRVQALCDVGPIKTPRDVVLLVPRLRRGCEYESYSMHQATSHRWKQLPRLATRRGQGCQTACTS